MKLLSADDVRESINQRKPTTPEELKEALIKLKRFRAEVSPVKRRTKNEPRLKQPKLSR